MKLLLPLFLLLCVSACQPEIGESCQSSLDCSSQGNRYCDLSQPGGYCTLPGCEEGSCPDEGVCVAFRPEDPRLSINYCMYGCDNGSDCRGDEGYRCLSEASFGLAGEAEARVLDGSGKKFCAQAAVEPDERDAGK